MVHARPCARDGGRPRRYLAFLAAPFSKVTRITLLLVTASPSGGFSGLWCSLCNADLALSVAVTTASTLVSVPLMPASGAGRGTNAFKMPLLRAQRILEPAVEISATFGSGDLDRAPRGATLVLL